MEDLERLMALLHWDQPEEEQKRAIEKLLEYKDQLFHILISGTQKPQWYNAVELIGRLNHEDKVKMVPQMLILFQDINWPGAIEARKIMEELSHDELRPHLLAALEIADYKNDTVWICWIKQFVENIGMTDIIEDCAKIFKKADE